MCSPIPSPPGRQLVAYSHMSEILATRRCLGTTLAPMLLLLFPPCAAAFSATAKAWDVVVHRAGEKYQLSVPENQPVLAAVEAAGLLPGSECRRGRCLSCAARVTAGEPFSLRVASDTALCEAAHAEDLVLLCSAFVCGPGLELELGLEGEAWEIQHCLRWQTGYEAEEMPRGVAPRHFRMPEDVATFLERCRSAESAADTTSTSGAAVDANSTGDMDED